VVVVVREEMYGLQRCSAGVCVLKQRGSRSDGRRQRVLLSDAEVRDVAYCLYKAALVGSQARCLDWTGVIRGAGLDLSSSKVGRTAILDNSCRGINGFQLKLSGERQSGVKGGL
jgi:hypothetical protein